MITTFNYPQQSAEFEAFVAANPGCHVWHDGAVMRVFTGDDIPSAAVPQSVTPRQIRLALNAAGLRSTVEQAVEQAVAAGSQDMKDWWEYALDIERNHPLIVSIAGQLGINEQRLDELFTLAASL